MSTHVSSGEQPAVTAEIPHLLQSDPGSLYKHIAQTTFYSTLGGERVLWYPEFPYPQKPLARLDGNWEPITPMYFKVLDLLGSRPGRLVTYDRFAEEIWDDPHFGFTTKSNIQQSIMGLRRWLGMKDLGHPRTGIITTVRGLGYKAVA